VTTHWKKGILQASRIMVGGRLLSLTGPPGDNAWFGVDVGGAFSKPWRRWRPIPGFCAPGWRDHLRAITEPGAEAGDLRRKLEGQGLRQVRLEAVEPSLEDVFLALAGEEPRPET
jgi:hypothetical protein